jgi:hypothetical protein
MERPRATAVSAGPTHADPSEGARIEASWLRTGVRLLLKATTLSVIQAVAIASPLGASHSDDKARDRVAVSLPAQSNQMFLGSSRWRRPHDHTGNPHRSPGARRDRGSAGVVDQAFAVDLPQGGFGAIICRHGTTVSSRLWGAIPLVSRVETGVDGATGWHGWVMVLSRELLGWVRGKRAERARAERALIRSGCGARVGTHAKPPGGRNLSR